ncbi:type II toxin-antitoxin system RelE/ParE family toxin [Paenibacillus sp. M1]|uniref:Type II toxin-antitoxin system RelE/ParE family toxin n=1 Tax=Paenibacillus haidiansis TaxID=1574488 RepID=A0ABU7VNG9_9BACL
MNEVIFYTTAKGNSDVEDFLRKLDAQAVAGDKSSEELLDNILYVIDRVEDGMPHARSLQKGIRELRPGPYRITYFKWRDKLVLLTVFKKQSQQTPAHEIERAVRRMKDWISRHGK